LLFECARSTDPFQIIPLHSWLNRSFFFWHVFVAELPPGTCYAWRIDGPHDTATTGFRFDRDKVLIDPWARAVTTRLWDRARACREGDNVATSMRGSVIEDVYDWEGDKPLQRSLQEAVIYELHVGGFTRHPSSGVEHPGTFAAVIEKIPYLRELGITDVELMPVMAFDEQDVPPQTAALGLQNFWGYSTHSFFSPHPGYCASPEVGSHMREFRDMVKALHKAGIGVILDVAFNHTAEGGHQGPTINFRGIDNDIFYHLDPRDRSRYRDYTGCGNTFNCNHPVVANFILDCLEYWVRQMHVDGFRFDLASVMARGEDGNPLYHAPVLWNIEFSEILARTHIIAEAWDAGGLYQVGDFPGYRWAEWNGKYRDVIRRFVRGDGNMVGEVASRMSGSSDLYERLGRLPRNSTNFVTCHDGFTLRDLVSYNNKHNHANGEDNRDGLNDNLSWNCGAEGETDDAQVNALRERQAKNLVAILLLSQGVPMLLSGDEVLRSQRGNNNSYCQNNPLAWFDWTHTASGAGMLRFTREMIALRRRHPCLMRRYYLRGRPRKGQRLPDVTWHGTRLYEPPWEDPHARVLAFTLGGLNDENDLHIMLNMSDNAVALALPHVDGLVWHRAVDTFRTSPEDILPLPGQPALKSETVSVRPRTVMVLENRISR
jgi:isoamylase